MAKWWLFMALAALLAWGAAIAPPGPTEAEQQQCEMWEIWHADRRAGVAIEKRYGWPDQAGRYYEECDQ